ncbi:hypothetical protein K504DRAFT_366673 [Pleomassaria siparia CBS 279.74]|uniref:LITAF domain-containing protein n=1 Tax=Pleomassaria siparia CBS 279.74 TaxID=1314801 RepID=A0A6G1KRN5_9PLEO|nr:hypothetical protein K504DRAFT_366673 [Pleomassaria siparia CBS 279.74]
MPQDAAPAYDDVIHNHPTNQFHQPSGSTSGYATVPQDDVELHAHEHVHSSPTGPSQPETIAQTPAGVLQPRPHVHCEQCDIQTMARERRENERHCCAMVAKTFMLGFICMMVLGIVITTSMAKANKYRHDH